MSNILKSLIVKVYSFHESSILNQSNRFDYLDGFRGFLALLVVMQHFQGFFDAPGDYKIFSGLGHFIGVMGFFVLSSFLLTYRLLIEFSKSKSQRESILILIQYAIRRFFRIYVIFFLFSLAVHKGPYYIGGYFHYYYGSYYAPFFDIITLKSAGYNHLWTIAPEIKYYFIIPFISLSIIKLGKYWKWAWCLTFLIMILNVSFLNIFQITVNDLKIENAYLFTPRLAIFYAGSLVSIAYFKLEKSNLNEFVKSNFKIQVTINFILIIMLVFGVRLFSEYWQTDYDPSLEWSIARNYTYNGFYWAFFLFLMLIGSPNYVTEFFGSARFLKICGKLSFGIYLLHPMCMTILNDFIKTHTIIEMVILCISFSFLVGYLFFILIENQLMLLANRLCKLIETSKLFTKQDSLIT